MAPDYACIVSGIHYSRAVDGHCRDTGLYRYQSGEIVVLVLVFDLALRPFDSHGPCHHLLTVSRLGLEVQPLQPVDDRLREFVMRGVTDRKAHLVLSLRYEPAIFGNGVRNLVRFIEEAGDEFVESLLDAWSWVTTKMMPAAAFTIVI